MTKKNSLIFFTCLGTVIFSISFNCFANEAPNTKKTMWNVVNKSLTELLNDGWKPVNQSSHIQASNNDETFGYLLMKDGKYITCLIRDPNIEKGTYSRCRALN